jgi:hypothetical protein
MHSCYDFLCPGTPSYALELRNVTSTQKRSGRVLYALHQTYLRVLANSCTDWSASCDFIGAFLQCLIGVSPAISLASHHMPKVMTEACRMSEARINISTIAQFVCYHAIIRIRNSMQVEAFHIPIFIPWLSTINKTFDDSNLMKTIQLSSIWNC